MGKRALLVLGVLTALVGCQGPDHIDPSLAPPSTEPTPFPTPVAPGAFLDPRVMASAPVSQEIAPPAITGGTLFVTNAGDTAIVSDPDRDRIVVVDLVAGGISGIAALPPGAEPFRAVEDADATVHVVLRGTGDVFSFSPAAIANGQRHHVCAMPRGIAFDAEADSLVVACRSGALVTLGTDGSIRSQVQVTDPAFASVETDLRDVVITNGHLFVSTFRSANLIEVDPASGSIRSRGVPDTAPGFGMGFFEDGPRGGVAGGAQGFSPSVAWRTVVVPGSGIPGSAQTIAAVHQRASDTPVEPQPGGYGAGGAGCGESSIVQSAVTFYFPDSSGSTGIGHSDGLSISGATLPVDVAFSRDGTRMTVVAAANESGQQAVQSYDASLAALGSGAGCMTGDPLLDASGNQVTLQNAVAAAYDGAGRLLVQQREPSALFYMGRTIALTDASGHAAPSRFDTGHAVFHGNSGAFIACASCHPEGGDDGRVWNFDGIGPRRTPALHGELRGTEPFHWDGDMTDLNVLVHQVFTSRMSGPELSTTQVDTLGNWLDAIPAPVHEAGVDAAAVSRGQTIFFGEAQCGSCHSGSLLTNNATLDVGTGGDFQVPSLIGVSYRTPLMHDGSCPTLRSRLVDPSCSGGDHHGHTSSLTPTQIDDLLAFLNTL